MTMRRRPKIALSLCAAILVAAWVSAGQPLKTWLYFFTQSLVQLVEEVAQQREIQRDLAVGLSFSDGSLISTGFEGTIIYVLGDSTARRHLSLYGYHRQTTPKLNRLHDFLLVQQDTSSRYSDPTLSLAEILSSDILRREGSRESYRLNLITELRRAGFKTWWLSNKNDFRMWDDPSSLIGKQAHVQHFSIKSVGTSLWSEFYDDQLFPDLDAALQDSASRKFVVMNLYALHSGYCDGIPQQFRNVLKEDDGLGKKFFGDAPDLSARVNCYDNAVRYVDDILDRIITKAKSQTTPTIMIYLSVRGDSPAQKSWRNPLAPSIYYNEVPHLWYFNNDAREVLSPKITALKANLDKPYAAGDMFHTVLDIVGANPIQYDASRSIASNEFLSHSRKTVSGGDLGQIVYHARGALGKMDYLEIARLELAYVKATRPLDYRKLGAHRVNTIGKLIEAKSLFAGVEVDVVFDNKAGDFFVYHPPKESHGLKLRELLLAAKDRTDLWFWLDWKNAKEEFFDAAFVRLVALEKEFSIKSRTLVETGSDAIFSSLRGLSRSGFTHSYYVPTREAILCTQQPRETKCVEFAKAVAARARQIGAGVISFDGSASQFINANMHNFADLRIASWQLNLSASDQGFSSKIGPLDGIDILLVRFPSVFSY